MWIFWVCGIVFVASWVWMIIIWVHGDELIDYDSGIVPILLVIVCGIVLGVGGFTTVYSQKRVDRINADFGTNYTRNEYFWQGDYIESKHIGDKIRLEMME